jgi:hypothetical protein
LSALTGGLLSTAAAAAAALPIASPSFFLFGPGQRSTAQAGRQSASSSPPLYEGKKKKRYPRTASDSTVIRWLAVKSSSKELPIDTPRWCYLLVFQPPLIFLDADRTAVTRMVLGFFLRVGCSAQAVGFFFSPRSRMGGGCGSIIRVATRYNLGRSGRWFPWDEGAEAKACFSFFLF